MVFHLKLFCDSNLIKNISIIRKYRSESISTLKEKIQTNQYIYEIDTKEFSNEKSMEFISEIEKNSGRLLYFADNGKTKIEVDKNALLIELEKKKKGDLDFKDKVLNNYEKFEKDLMKELDKN